MILFEKEKMHRFKRHYLLCSLVLSFVIPLMTFNIVSPQLNKEIVGFLAESNMIEKMPEQIVFLINMLYPESNMDDMVSGQFVFPTSAYVVENNYVARSVDYAFMTKALYIIVATALLLRLCYNIFRLLHRAKKGRCIVCNDKILVLIKDNLVPFSFGRYIYINEDDYNNGVIADEMIRHEQAHVDQKHSLDIVFIELLIAVCWFNPVLYLYRRKIKQNHEFLADEAVLSTDNDIMHYQNILMGIISKNGSTGLASSINYSIIKKRFIMMRKETSQRKARYKKAILLPVLLLAICMFSLHIKSDEYTAIQKAESIDKNISPGEDFIIPGKGVSDELLKEFDDIVVKYLEEDKNYIEADGTVKWKSTDFSEADKRRMYEIYVQMDRIQQTEQLIFLLGPFYGNNLRLDSFVKNRGLNINQWEFAVNAEILFLNGERVDKSELGNYTPDDVVVCINNVLNKEKNITQSALWTKKGYKDYMEQYEEKISLSALFEINPMVIYVIRYVNEKDYPYFVYDIAG